MNYSIILAEIMRNNLSSTELLNLIFDLNNLLHVNILHFQQFVQTVFPKHLDYFCIYSFWYFLRTFNAEIVHKYTH